MEHHHQLLDFFGEIFWLCVQFLCQIWCRAINLLFVSHNHFLQKLWNVNRAMSDDRGLCACSGNPTWKISQQWLQTQTDHQVATKYRFFRRVKVNCVKVPPGLMLSVLLHSVKHDCAFCFFGTKPQHFSFQCVIHLRCHLDRLTCFTVIIEQGHTKKTHTSQSSITPTYCSSIWFLMN